MVGSNGTLMTMRLVRSKLRKREESSVSPVTATNVEAPPSHHHQNNSSSYNNSNHHHNHHSSSNHNNHQHQLENGYSVPTPVAFRQSPSSVWVFPPLPPQPNIYSYNANSQVSTWSILLIHTAFKHSSVIFRDASIISRLIVIPF